MALYLMDLDVPNCLVFMILHSYFYFYFYLIIEEP